MSFTLINARPSPFGRKIAIAMLEKGIDYEVKYDLPWGNETCTPQYSPLQQLPILITESGESIYDSVYILEWLEGRFPTPPLLPIEVDARLDAKKRQMLGERVMEFGQSLIFEMHRPDVGAAWVERQTRKIIGGLAELDRIYGAQRPLPGAAIDLGDIAVATTVLLFEFVVVAKMTAPIDALVWRGRYPALTRFVAALESRPSFVATVPQHMVVDLSATVS